MRITRRPALQCLAAAIPIIAVAIAACHPQADDAEPTDRADQIEEDTIEGRIVEFALEPGAATPAELKSVASHVETLGDVHSAKVKVRAAKDDATVISIEMWGSNFPDEDTLANEMRDTFPFMKDAVITVAELEADGDGDPHRAMVEVAKDEDPEVVKQRIIDDLRAKGVQGDIKVDVRDDGNGNREVEVHVESDDPNDALAVDQE